jgi:hypothetical protein
MRRYHRSRTKRALSQEAQNSQKAEEEHQKPFKLPKSSDSIFQKFSDFFRGAEKIDLDEPEPTFRSILELELELRLN